MRNADTWLLPASTASRYLPSAVTWIAPCDPTMDPVPAPPAANGEPAIDVSEPSLWRSNAAMVLTPAVLSLTYTWPTTSDAADAVIVTPAAAPAASADNPTTETIRYASRSKRSSLGNQPRILPPARPLACSVPEAAGALQVAQAPWCDLQLLKASTSSRSIGAGMGSNASLPTTRMVMRS